MKIRYANPFMFCIGLFAARVTAYEFSMIDVFAPSGLGKRKAEIGIHHKFFGPVDQGYWMRTVAPMRAFF